MRKLVHPLLALALSVAAYGDIENELSSVQGEMPGCGLGVVSGDGLIYEQYAGYASLKFNIPITEDTIFNIGSISKHITAAVLFQLEKQDLLSRDDILSKFYPDGPEWFKYITLEHLVQHRSGIPDYLNDQAFAIPLLSRFTNNQEIALDLVFGRPISHDDIVANVMAGIQELNGPKFPSGSEMSYSNTGYLLLAEIFNNHTGQDIESLVDQLIFKPYEMNDSLLFQETSTDLNGIATGYEHSPHQGQKYRSLIESLASIGDGGMLTTVRDFSKWMEVLSSSDSPESDWHGFLVNPFDLDRPSTEVSWYQNGLEIEKYQGLIYQHYGKSTDNMNSYFWISPEHNIGYVRFCNFENLTRHRKADVYDYVDVAGSN